MPWVLEVAVADQLDAGLTAGERWPRRRPSKAEPKPPNSGRPVLADARRRRRAARGCAAGPDRGTLAAARRCSCSGRWERGRTAACPGSKPRSAVCSLMKLRISRPADVSRTSASAISPTTSAWLNRARRKPPPVPFPPSRNAGVSSRRAVCSAGTRPNTIAVATATPSENSSTFGSRRITASRGTRPSGISRATTTAMPPAGDAPPDGGAGQREQQALDQQLADQPGAAGAERGAHRHLLLAAGGAAQEHVGDVDAGDQQQQRRPPRPSCRASSGTDRRCCR